MRALKKSEQTRTKIVAALEELASQKDIDQITIREICALAHISIGTFYLYFQSKEEALLYVYYQCDDIFTHLVLDQAPIHNIMNILNAYYHMVDVHNMHLTRTIYTCHLKYHDAYFFSEDRSLFVLLSHEITLYSHKDNAKEMTWLVLEFCRGRIYNAAISFKEYQEDWYEESIQKTMTYLDYLINH